MDEFSDFQMAVHTPATKIGGGMGLPHGSNAQLPIVKGKGSRFPDSSPVHSLQSHSNSSSSAKSDLVLRSQSQQFSLSASSLPPVVPPPVSNKKFGTNVGSRLANYDLGLSFPTTTPPPVQMNGHGFQNMSNGTGLIPCTGLTISNPSKTISNNPSARNYNQDLLIGEEDKYSALRMFIETDINSTASIFENPQAEPPPPQPTSSNIDHSTNATTPAATNFTSSAYQDTAPTPTNCAIDFTYSSPRNHANMPSTPDSSDFGDFQSFTGFNTAPPIEETKLNSITTFPATSFLPNDTNDFLNNIQINASMVGSMTKTTPAVPIENGTFDSDGEDFGDFVSVEPVASSVLPVKSTTFPPLSNSHTKESAPIPNDLSPTNIMASLSISSEPPPIELEPEINQSSSNIDSLIGLDVFSNSFPADLECPQVEEKSPSLQDIDESKGSEDYLKELGSPQNQFQAPSLTPSTFIRTSLIRNDEVTDIDPIRWSQSLEEGTAEYALDCGFERKENCTGSKKESKFLDISPETRSIASLDLGNYVSVDYSEATNNINNNINNNNNHIKASLDQILPVQNITQQRSGKFTPALSQSPPMSSETDDTAIYDDYDKYQCFREECENEKERYLTESSRCLEACKLLISNAFSVFNAASTSEVIREVVADEKGYSYVMNILEIYQISQRIQKSAERIGLEMKLQDSFLEINNLWDTLTAFLLGTCVSTEICQEGSSPEMDCGESLPQDGDSGSPSYCGVCLCPVDTSQGSGCQYLDYGGKMYHCKCANFYVNAVDSILPSLSSCLSSSSGENNVTTSDSNSMVYEASNGHSPPNSTYAKHEKTNTFV